MRARAKRKFQFQQGSIITTKVDGNEVNYDLFQFQQGSIITLRRDASNLTGTSFNSNKVQL